jgi:hypothetical protein
VYSVPGLNPLTVSAALVIVTEALLAGGDIDLIVALVGSPPDPAAREYVILVDVLIPTPAKDTDADPVVVPLYCVLFVTDPSPTLFTARICTPLYVVPSVSSVIVSGEVLIVEDGVIHELPLSIEYL